ncbi:unnamed protein product [Malus baccata var. baccata]
MQILEARWHIEAYKKRPDANQVLLEIAKQDFDRVQCTLQRDLQEVSRLQEEVERGETANSISCMVSGSLYISEESARQYTSNLVENSWKNLNKDGAFASPCTKQFVKAARNLARISQCIYQYGDEHGAPVMSKESNPISDYRSHLKTITQTHIYARWLLATKRVEFILVSWSISNMH